MICCFMVVVSHLVRVDKYCSEIFKNMVGGRRKKVTESDSGFRGNKQLDDLEKKCIEAGTHNPVGGDYGLYTCKACGVEYKGTNWRPPPPQCDFDKVIGAVA